MAGVCLAMWSGPRNISTAMMRSWENRSDTQVVDEPFYAHYLHATGLEHPMRDAVISHGETDWLRVVEQLTVRPASGIFYQKHITTHWFSHFSTEWLDELEHVFLLREPEPVVASYSAKRGNLTASDLGYEQQEMLFDLITTRQGKQPLIIDSKRFLNDPESQLKSLCFKLNIPFESSMLLWPPGVRISDGVWGQHWYDAVIQSTGFAQARSSDINLNEEQRQIAMSCQPSYDRLVKFAL